MANAAQIELRRRSRLRNLVVRAEREGAALQFWARTGTLIAIAIALLLQSRWDKPLLFVLGALFVFFLIGLVQFRLTRRRYQPAWLPIVIGLVDIVLVTTLLIVPNPWAEGATMPAAMQLREGGFKYLLIFICLGALSLSPRVAVWLGLAAALSWTAGIIWVAHHPGTIIPATSLYSLNLEERLKFYLNPNFLDAFEQATNVFVILIMAAIISLVVSRSRRLADDYINAERARGNLARHFSPNVVDELATSDEPFGPVRRQDIAVIFADIVGFTAYSAEHPAEDVFELLRQFHRRMEQVVFDHGGTVDNYIGDCIMATFGVPRAGADDATRALRCAEAMIEALDEWNAFRRSSGMSQVDVRIGANFGPVVLGAVGSERNLSIAVVGDTVNVASRLQALCRELDAHICIGASLIEAARAENGLGDTNRARDHGPVQVRGREGQVHVWTVARAPGIIAVTAPT